MKSKTCHKLGFFALFLASVVLFTYFWPIFMELFNLNCELNHGKYGCSKKEVVKYKGLIKKALLNRETNLYDVETDIFDINSNLIASGYQTTLNKYWLNEYNITHFKSSNKYINMYKLCYAEKYNHNKLKCSAFSFGKYDGYLLYFPIYQFFLIIYLMMGFSISLVLIIIACINLKKYSQRNKYINIDRVNSFRYDEGQYKIKSTIKEKDGVDIFKL